MTSNKNKDYIGIDIAKTSLQVCFSQTTGSYPYNESGLKKLIEDIKGYEDPFVICEATGGYERMLMDKLHRSTIAVALVTPSRVRAFAKSDGLKAKTDPIDAALLLRFGQEKKLRATPAPSADQVEIEALMDRRSQLTETLAREKNRLQNSPACICKSIEKMIRLIEKEIKAIEGKIKALIEKDQKKVEQSSLMQSVVGVGETTAWTILAYLPEITILNRNQIVALAGIAPFNKDTGTFKGKRKIEGGRAKIRKCLYMAAQSAAIHNPHIKTYVDQLRARGMPYKCAITAAMRKILIHLQSILKNPQKILA